MTAPPSRPLAALNGARPPAPDWFARMLAVPFEDGAVDVEGARIVFRRWAPADSGAKPGLLFVHGGVAHKSWWDFIAPAFVETHAVAALDLSGMGDSGWRDSYRMELYAHEAMAVMESAGLLASDAKPVIAGHSFGGWVALQAARDHGARLGLAVALDSPIRPPDMQRRNTPPARPRRLYATQEQGLARFHLLPEQQSGNLFLLDHIAREGLMRTAGEDGAPAWTWKFDPDLWNKLAYSPQHPAEFLARIACPLAMLRGEDSALMPDDVWNYMRTIMPAGTPMVSIPAAQHHLMMDQPIAIIAALRALLAAGVPNLPDAAPHPAA